MKPESTIIIKTQLDTKLEQDLRRLREAILEYDTSKDLPEWRRLSEETITKLWNSALEEAKGSEVWNGLSEEGKCKLVNLSYNDLKGHEIRKKELKADIEKLIKNMNSLGSDVEGQMARIDKVEGAIVSNECALTEEKKKNAVKDLKTIRATLSYFQKYISQVNQKVSNKQELRNTKEYAKYIEARLKEHMDYLKRMEDAVAEDAVAEDAVANKEIQKPESSPTPSSSDSNPPSQGATTTEAPSRSYAAAFLKLMQSIFSAIMNALSAMFEEALREREEDYKNSGRFEF